MASVMMAIDLPAPSPIALDVAATDITATAGEDYSLAAPSLTIEAGKNTGAIQLNITDDGDVEGNEAIELTISSSESLPDGWSFDNTTHILAIADDEEAVGFASYTGVYDFDIEGIVNQPLVVEDAERVFVRVESTRPAPMGGFDLRYDVTQGASRLASTH